MTVSLIFSLFAVVVVSVVTLYVGTNRVQFNKTKNNLHSTKVLNDSRYEQQQKKLQNLVNAINQNDTDLNKFTNNLNNNFVELKKNTKHDLSDMKNNIKNYQHINSANMLGVDKRMSENYAFLDNQHHDFKNDYILKKTHQDSNIHHNLGKIKDHEKNFSNYKLVMERQQKRQDKDVIDFRDDLQATLTGNINSMTSNLDDQSKELINTIELKYAELDNRIRTYYVNRNGSNINDAINNYYFFNNDYSFSNITNMNDLLHETDVGINHIYANSNNIHQHKIILDGLKSDFDSDGLRKSTFDNWIQDANGTTYQKIIANEDHLQRLENRIGSNIDKIANLRSAIDLINNSNLEDLTEMIGENTNVINNLYNSNLTLIRSNIRIQNSNINYKTSFDNIQTTLLEKNTFRFNDINVKNLTFTENDDENVDISTKFTSLEQDMHGLKTSFTQTSNDVNNVINDFDSRIPRKMFDQSQQDTIMIDNDTTMFTYLEYNQPVKFQENVDLNGSISMNFNKLKNTTNNEEFVAYVKRIATDSTINRSDMMNKINNTTDDDYSGTFILSNVEINDEAATVKTKDQGLYSFSNYVQSKIDHTISNNNTINNAWTKTDDFDKINMKSLIYDGDYQNNSPTNTELIDRLGNGANVINLNGRLNVKGSFNIDANTKPTFASSSGEVVLNETSYFLSNIRDIPSISEMTNFTDDMSVNDTGFKHTVNGNTTYYKFPQLPVSLHNFNVIENQNDQNAIVDGYDMTNYSFTKTFNNPSSSSSSIDENTNALSALSFKSVTKNNIIKELSTGSIDLPDQTLNLEKIKLGNVCLKSDQSHYGLQICDQNCNNCVDMWHYSNAPPPPTTSS